MICFDKSRNITKIGDKNIKKYDENQMGYENGKIKILKINITNFVNNEEGIPVYLQEEMLFIRFLKIITFL